MSTLVRGSVGSGGTDLQPTRYAQDYGREGGECRAGYKDRGVVEERAGVEGVGAKSEVQEGGTVRVIYSSRSELFE